MRASIAALVLLISGQAGAGAEAIVTDGDTLILNGTTFRLEGIDAPKTDQTCVDQTGAPWRCGIEARDQLKTFIGKRDVRCDDMGPDAVYRKRRVAICRVDGEKISLNQWLVQEGWAFNFEPSAKGRFKADEKAARDGSKGLWKGCFVSPQMLRRWTSSVAKLLGSACPRNNDGPVRNVLFPDNPAMPPGCTIKGTLARRALISGHRGIYHLEACRSYRHTQKPERWFCSEDEAKAEGFRKALTCGL